MRDLRAASATILCCIFLSGCSPQDAMFFSSGVGTDLYAASALPSATLENLYIGLLCDQAGLQTSGTGDSLSCASLGTRSNNWTLIVQAGMNDIDRRCDEYLTWIDNRKRSQAPILKQLTDMSTATQAIMTITGTGANAIGIVGVAFGIAANTFTNINSRLIYEVNHSTIQSIVLGNDNRFRQDLMGVTINNRPAAIYALRSYLRLCMPFTIETQINNAVTLFEVGGVGSAGANPNPLISGFNVATVAIPQSRARFVAPVSSPKAHVVPPPPPHKNIGAINSFESRPEPKTIGEYQGALCAERDEKIGSLRKAMVDFFQGSGGPDDRARADRIQSQGILQTDLDQLDPVLEKNKDCALKLHDPAGVARMFR